MDKRQQVALFYGQAKNIPRRNIKMGKGYNNEGDSQVDVVIDDDWGKAGYWAKQDEEARKMGLISPMEDIVPANPSPTFNSNSAPENNDMLFNPGMPVSQQGEYEDSGRGDMGYLQSNLPSQVYQGPQVPRPCLKNKSCTNRGVVRQ